MTRQIGAWHDWYIDADALVQKDTRQALIGLNFLLYTNIPIVHVVLYCTVHVVMKDVFLFYF